MSSTEAGILDPIADFDASCIRTELPAPLAEAVVGLGSGRSGKESETDSSGGEDKERAADIIRSIGRDFVELRKQGRSPAWAELEDRLMTNAHVLISAGMLSPKDWIGIAVNIEEFRKQEQGTSVLPADFIAGWLSEPSDIEPKEIKRPAPLPVKVKRKTGKKAKA